MGKTLYSCSYWVKKLPVNTTLIRVRESTRESGVTNTPGEESADNHTLQGTREPIAYNSKLSSTWIFQHWVRHKVQSKLWPHIVYAFSCSIHGKWQIHICKFSLKVSWPWDRNPLETRHSLFQHSQKYWFLWLLSGCLHKDLISQGNKTFTSLLSCQDKADTLLTAVHLGQRKYTEEGGKMKAGEADSSFWAQAKPPLPCCRLCVQAATEKLRDGHYMEPAPWPWVTAMTVFHPEGTWQARIFSEDGTSPTPQLHWMRDRCPMLCPSQEPPAWAVPGAETFTLPQRPAVLVTAWLWSGLAATYRVRVLELNTRCEHAPGESQVCAPHCKWVGKLLTTAAACNHEQCQQLVFNPHFWQPLLLHKAETWKKCPLTWKLVYFSSLTAPLTDTSPYFLSLDYHKYTSPPFLYSLNFYHTHIWQFWCSRHFEVKDTKHCLCNIQDKEVLQLLCSPVTWKQSSAVHANSQWTPFLAPM